MKQKLESRDAHARYAVFLSSRPSLASSAGPTRAPRSRVLPIDKTKEVHICLSTNLYKSVTQADRLGAIEAKCSMDCNGWEEYIIISEGAI